jgi:hypothetical protein
VEREYEDLLKRFFVEPPLVMFSCKKPNAESTAPRAIIVEQSICRLAD